MSDTSKAASGFNRRKFLQGAVFTGAAALTAERLSGQGRPKAERILGVAYRLHYEPMNLAVMEMCRKKEFGKIKTFTRATARTSKHLTSA